MIPLLTYGLLTVWLTTLIAVLSTRFATNAKVRASHYIAYSFGAVILLMGVMWLFAPVKGDWEILNLSLYAILGHIIILFIYAYLFPVRHWKRRNRTYEIVGVSMVLCSTAGVLLTLQLIRLLSVVWVVG